MLNPHIATSFIERLVINMITLLTESTERFRKKIGFYIVSQINCRLDSSTMSRIKNGKLQNRSKTFLTYSVIAELKIALCTNSAKEIFFPNDEFVKKFLYELLRMMIHELSLESDLIVQKFKHNVTSYFVDKYKVETLHINAMFEQYFEDKQNIILSTFNNIVDIIDYTDDNLTSNLIEENVIKVWISHYLTNL